VFPTGFVCQVTAPGAEAKNSSSSRFRVTSCVSIAGTEMEQPKRWKNAADFAVENGLNRHFWAPSWGGSYVAGSGCVSGYRKNVSLGHVNPYLSSYHPTVTSFPEEILPVGGANTHGAAKEGTEHVKDSPAESRCETRSRFWNICWVELKTSVTKGLC